MENKITPEQKSINYLKSAYGVTEDDIYLVMVHFMGDWSILVYCPSESEANKELEYRKKKCSWQLKIEKYKR